MALSFVTVGITFKFVGINLDSFIYAFCQILLWTASGLQNFNFIMDEIVPLFKEKINVIESYFLLSEKEKQKYEKEIEKNKEESEVVKNGQ